MEKEIRQLEERIKELGLETTIINDVVNIYIPSYFKGIKTTYGRLKYKINDEESIKNALNELKKISLPMILEERIENLEKIFKKKIKEFLKSLKVLHSLSNNIIKNEKEIKNLEREVKKENPEPKYYSITHLEVLKLRKEMLENIIVLNEAIKFNNDLIEKQKEYLKEQDKMIVKYKFLLDLSDYYEEPDYDEYYND